MGSDPWRFIMTKKTIVPVLTLFLILAGVMAASAQTAGWKRLAEKDVNFSVDHDRIDVNDDAMIREIRMSAQYSPVTFSRIVVSYEGGRKQEIPFAHLVAVDQFSPAVTLSGDGGIIDGIDVWYSTEGMTGKKAKIAFYGRTGAMMPATVATGVMPASTGDGWKRLAEKDVNFAVDHDRIDISDADRIREIRMSAQYSPVTFSRIVIDYEGGRKQEVPFAHLVSVDQFSPSVTLSGDGGVIDGIDVWYSTEGMTGKKAKIAFYGRPGRIMPVAPATAVVPVTGGDAGWQRLAEKDVNFSVDHDRIDVNDDDLIREIRMSAQYSPVTFSKIVVSYRGGRKQDVPFAHLVAVDQFSPAVTLSGDGGVIEGIDVWYSTEGMTGKKAKITFFGR